ncbi:MAG: TIGR02646 family protein [Desulfovibrio sp.]|nr:TIGR02646 family protein [Desulfovibrio sp.]
MKTVFKGSSPPSLQKYLATFPQARWGEMRDDGLHGGKNVYKEVRAHLFVDQGGLCAYCESSLDWDAPQTMRVEHFHPKSDRSLHHNWDLAWENLLLTCLGGEKGDYPLPENLSCDAHKKNVIHDKDIVNPLFLPPFPQAFLFNLQTGKLQPNPAFCATYPKLPGHVLASTEALLINTLLVLNLNYDRLCCARLEVLYFIERQKKLLRLQNIPANQALPRLVQRFFASPWPQFFTVVRQVLNPYADQFLMGILYQG